MKCDPKVLNRLKRCSGQMEGILKMLDEQRSCEEVLAQLSAVRTGIDRAMALIGVANLMEHLDIDDKFDDETVQEAINLLLKTR